MVLWSSGMIVASGSQTQVFSIHLNCDRPRVQIPARPLR